MGRGERINSEKIWKHERFLTTLEVYFYFPISFTEKGSGQGMVIFTAFVFLFSRIAKSAEYNILLLWGGVCGTKQRGDFG